MIIVSNLYYRSPSEPVNNVTIVEVLNHNQVFDFNQMERVLSQTNQQSVPISSDPSINSPRPSRSSNSENSILSPRSSNRQHQSRNISTIEESVSSARSSSHSESNDRTNNTDDSPQRSTNEMLNEGQRIKVRMGESEDGRPRRRSKRQEVVPVATDQEIPSNYEHLVLPTSMQPRSSPVLSNFVPTDIATILPTRPQVIFIIKFIFEVIVSYYLFILKLPIGRGRGARRKVNGDSLHPPVGADRIRVTVNSSPRMLQPVPTPYIPVRNMRVQCQKITYLFILLYFCYVNRLKIEICLALVD